MTQDDIVDVTQMIFAASYARQVHDFLASGRRHRCSELGEPCSCHSRCPSVNRSWGTASAGSPVGYRRGFR